eukprot:scaffold92699_cov60-Phaeocystis_antarctica.AAC.7
MAATTILLLSTTTPTFYCSSGRPTRTPTPPLVRSARRSRCSSRTRTGWSWASSRSSRRRRPSY